MYTYGIHIVYRFYPLTYKLKRMINLEIVFNYSIQKKSKSFIYVRTINKI